MPRQRINEDDVLADIQQRITAAGGKISYRALSQQLTDAGKETYIPYIRRFTTAGKLNSAQEFETAESTRSTPMISDPAAPNTSAPVGGGS